MSMLSKFLNKSALVTGIVAISVISLPIAEVSAQGRNGANQNNNNIVINNNNGGRNFNRGGNRGNRGYRNNRRGNRGSGLLPGLIGGAILYSAFNNNRRYDNRYNRYDRYDNRNRRYNSRVDIRYSSPGYRYNRYNYYTPSVPYYSRPRTEVVYVDRPVVQQVPVYTQPQQQGYVQQPQQQQYAAQNDNCLQSREYTTTIEIGGESVPAYGQACLQQDGSWKFGDPVAVPNF
ncbi:MAG: hypothetical protein HOM01_06015 [Kordiimonadaceae bacterium]|nr:hypothetical protein [Kordiimonadaceae bacterium]